MIYLQKIKECRVNRRCGSFLSCPACGESWRRGKFKKFVNTYERKEEDIITYIVIKSDSIDSLRVGLNKCFCFLGDIRELKKRGKISDFYSRLEVSFGKTQLGFNPHINFLFFGDIGNIEELAKSHGLGVWKQKKENTKKTVLSIIWYMLKFNNIGIEKGESVRKAMKKKSSILHTKRFNHKAIDYIDEYIDIDFSFMGVYPIRSKEEIKLRKEIKEERRKLNSKLKKFLKNTLI